MSERRIVYYKDEMDDFTKRDCKSIIIDEKYKYLHDNLFWNIASFFLYRIIATPLAFLYMKVKFHLRILGKEKLSNSKNEGYYLYINHTQTIGDALLPTILTFPKKTYVMVHPYNVSIPFWGGIIKLLGPLPVPGTVQAWKKFSEATDQIIKHKRAITIYPEAHVWDYYTNIRNFGSGSFKLPIKNNVPCYCATVTYQKNGKRTNPRMVVYIDGPFFPDVSEGSKVAQQKLRDTVYETMCKRSQNSNIEFIKYEKIKEEIYD